MLTALAWVASHLSTLQMVLLVGGLLWCLMLLVGSKTVLRWPLLIVVSAMIGVELFLYSVVRWSVHFIEVAAFINRRHSKLMTRLKEAKDYESWRVVAQELDANEGREEWKAREESPYYNHLLIKALLRDLKESRENGDLERLTKILRTCCSNKDIGGILNENIYSQTRVGTKFLVHDFIAEFVECLRYVNQRRIELEGSSGASAATTGEGEAGLPPPSPSTPGLYDSDDSDDGFDDEPATIVGGGRGRGRGVSGGGGGVAAVLQRRRPSVHLHGSGSSEILQGKLGRHHPQNYTLATQALDITRPHTLPAPSQTTTPIAHGTLNEFFRKARRAFGNTALCLSGGAGMGHYHWGVVHALLHENLLPNIISGTSAGAVVASFICTRTNEELKELLTPEGLLPHMNSFSNGWIERLKLLWREGVMFDSDEWLRKITWHTNDLTFEEAYQKTGRILNITVTSRVKFGPPLLLNHLSTPHVTIASAVIASAAVPTFVHPVQLRERRDGREFPFGEVEVRFRDGSFETDLPITGLSQMFNCSFFIVSQTNPHIVPFFYNSMGSGGQPTGWRRWTGGYRGGFSLAALELWLKLSMRKNLKFLATLDLLPNVFGQDWSYIFLQTFYGHVTLVPRVAVRDFFCLVSDPSLADMRRYFSGGQLATWSACSMIRNRMVIDQTLAQCTSE